MMMTILIRRDQSTCFLFICCALLMAALLLDRSSCACHAFSFVTRTSAVAAQTKRRARCRQATASSTTRRRRRRRMSATTLTSTATICRSLLATPSSSSSSSSLSSQSGEEETTAAATAMDDDDDAIQRQNLFQQALQNLQQQDEGIPVLGCDATQVHTMNAALWTTLADMSESDEAQKMCLVFDQIPVNALQAFVTDLVQLQAQQADRLLDHLPELKRIDVSLLGGGVGPALVMETTARPDADKLEKETRQALEAIVDETKCIAALKRFVNRVVVGLEQCPYTKTADISGVGLQHRGVASGPVGYRFQGKADACAAVAAFWNCACEVLTTPETELSTTLLSLPCIGPGDDDAAHARFAAVVELISRNLCLFRGDNVLGLVHFHPAYQRSRIHPKNKPAYGHLPPTSWLRSMLRHNGQTDKADSMTDEALSLSDYQRRAPFTMINILRGSQLNAAVGGKSIVDLELDDGTIEKASGIPLYCRNALRLANEGRDKLQSAVDADMAQAWM